MDNIKNLISQTHKDFLENEKLLTEAFRLLSAIVSQKSINESFEQATDMCVILGECCVKNNIKKVAYDSIKLYFSLDPQENQYLARAYLLQALLIHPQRFDDESALDKPIGFVLKAINFSKKDKSFHYLIYNSSLVYYEVVRNYLRVNYYQFLCKSLSQVCKSLEEVNDSNLVWRSQLMILLVQCHIDAGHRKEVIQTIDTTANFIAKHSPHLLKDLLTCLINNGIGTTEKYTWYTRNHPAMQVYIKLCKLKILKDKDSESSSIVEAKRILSLLIGTEENPAIGVGDSLNSKSDLQSSSSNSFNSKKLTNEQRCMLLLELAKISLQKSIFDVCHQSISKIQTISSEDMLPIIQEAEFINSELTMLESEAVNDKITPSCLKLRLTTIEKCKTNLLDVIRSGNNKLIELGCASLWNLCLPILQPNLVTKIVNNLALIADSLESTGCLNYKFCAQVHIEAGKGYALLDQTNDAIRYFKQALLLDRTGEYSELLEHCIYKLKMQEKLYEKPTDPCDIARQLLEQVRTTLVNENIPLEKLRPLLAQIGHCLAPDDFLVLLDHDLSVEESGNDKTINGKFQKTASWENVITRISSYLVRSGNVNDKNKGNLWMDLVRLSRKVQLWDICRVASCFAVLYDDRRWKNHFQNKTDSSSRKGNRISASNSNQQTSENGSTVDIPTIDSDNTDLSNNESKNKKREESDISISSIKPNRFEKSLLEQLVEVYFIRAEAFIQALRNEGAQLFTYPERPKDFKKHPKGFVKDTTTEDAEWTKYCDSLERLSNLIVNCFLRAATMSIDLQAPWLTQNAATYLWNYSLHIISLSEHGILVPSFQVIYDILKQMINENLIEIITQYGIILAHGILQKSMPTPQFTIDNIFETPVVSTTADKKGKKEKEPQKPKPTTTTGTGQIDSMAQYKKAMDICQYLMDITSDLPLSNTDNTIQLSISNNSNKLPSLTRTIDIRTKSLLIEIWVQCKQLLQQSIGRTLGADDSESKIGQRANVRAITAVQMVWISQNEFYKFPELLSVDECLLLIDGCEWDSSTVLLNLLLKLCQIVIRGAGSNSINTLVKINEKITKFCPNIKTTVSKAVGKGDRKEIEEKTAVSFMTFCHGVYLHKVSSQNTAVLMQCLKLFVKACCYARDANSYFLVSQITHYFWKIAQCLIERFSSVSQIKDDIEIIINCISQTVNKKRLKLFFESHTEEEELKIQAELEEKLPHNVQISDDQKLITINQSKSLFLTNYRRQPTKSSLEQDLKLRVQMYIAVFQSYFFEEKWTESLKTLDDAIAELPRTNHRLELFRHRLLTKVRLGQSIELDIHKFKNQREDEIALLWREIALRSTTLDSQLIAYKNSINVLKSKENDWMKVDLIMEMSQWMFHHDFPLEICYQYVDLAIDVLLNIEIIKKSPSVKSKSRSGSKKLGSSVKSSIKMEESVTKITKENESENTNSIPDDPEANVSFLGSSLQNYRPNSITDIEDIRLLSSLFICFTVQSKLMANSVENCYENVIMAHACVIRMWQVAMNDVAGAMKEIAKFKVETETLSKPKDKKDTKDKNNKIEQEPVKSKIPKRKGPVDWIPTTFEDWSLFEVSDNVLEALKSSTYMSTTGFHDATIKNMGQFMNCCDIFVDLLEEMGYELLSFPLLSLMDAISRTDETVPAKLLNQYVHIRLLGISIRLNMPEAVTHHKKFIDYPFVSPDYTAYVEIIKVKIQEYKMENKCTTLPMNFKHQSVVSLDVSHLLRKQTKFGYLHETWVKIGWKLIELGYNKEASEVICAAEDLSESLQDNEITSECKLLKATLLKNQGELQESLDYLDAFENNYSQFNLKQWSILTDLLTEIGMNDINSYKSICKRRIRLSRLKNHTEKRINEMKLSNQKTFTENLISRMNYGLLLLDKKIKIMDLGENMCWDNCYEVFENFLIRLTVEESVCLKNENFKYLTEILWEQISIYDTLITMADESVSQTLILSKLLVIENCLNFLTWKHDNVHRVCPLSEDASFSLSTDRQLSRVKLAMVDCLIEIYTRHVAKVTRSYLEHKKKDPLKQIVDEYVAEDLPNTDTLEWGQTILGICDRICCQLNDVHTLCSTIPEITAQCLTRYGHVLKLRAMEIYPSDNFQWLQLLMDVQESKPVKENDQSNLEINETESSPKIEEILNDNSIKMHSKFIKITKRKNAMLQSREYLSQAVELINQSISMSINYQFYENCSYAIELLLDILGQFETQLSVQLLCLYQNCRSSISMRHILLATLRQASMGQLAALLLQHNYLGRQAKFNESNLTESPLYRSVVEKLNSTFLSWKTTNVSMNQTDFMKEFSNITNGFFILQHSLNNNAFYAAFIDLKQKLSNTNKTTSKQFNSDKTKICRIETSPEQVLQLKNKWLKFKSDLESLVYDIENKNETSDRQRKLYLEIENENELLKAERNTETMKEIILLEVQKMEERYLELVQDVQEYLNPIFTQFDNIFINETDRGWSKSVKEFNSQPKESMILLVDEIFALTSLESISAFRSTISRDFSLQTLYHRLKGLSISEPSESSPNPDASKKKDKSKTPHRIVALREVNKKPGKVPTLNKQIPSGMIGIDVFQFRYIVDPFADTNSRNNSSLGTLFKNELIGPSNNREQITSRWIGLMGQNDFSSIEEIELYLKDATTILYVNTENLISLLTPQKVAELNTSELQLLCCFDGMKIRKTKDRIIRKASLTNVQDNQSQDSVRTAQLITLMGVKSLVCNQWSNIIDWTSEHVNKFMSCFIDDGLSVGESIQQLRNISQENKPESKGDDDEFNKPITFIKNNPIVYGLPNLMTSG